MGEGYKRTNRLFTEKEIEVVNVHVKKPLFSSPVMIKGLEHHSDEDNGDIWVQILRALLICLAA